MGLSNYVTYKPVGYASISATSSTAVALSANFPAASSASATSARPNEPTTPDVCIITPETAGIRIRDDGTSAANATSGGYPLAAGQHLEYDGNLGVVNFVSQSGTATVHVLYYRTH